MTIGTQMIAKALPSRICPAQSSKRNPPGCRTDAPLIQVVPSTSKPAPPTLSSDPGALVFRQLLDHSRVLNWVDHHFQDSVPQDWITPAVGVAAHADRADIGRAGPTPQGASIDSVGAEVPGEIAENCSSVCRGARRRR